MKKLLVLALLVSLSFAASAEYWWYDSGNAAVCWNVQQAQGKFALDLDGNHNTAALSWAQGWDYQYGNFSDVGVLSKSGYATQYGWAFRLKENLSGGYNPIYTFGGSEYFYLFNTETRGSTYPNYWVVCAKGANSPYQTRNIGTGSTDIQTFYYSTDYGTTWNTYNLSSSTTTPTPTPTPTPSPTPTATATPTPTYYGITLYSNPSNGGTVSYGWSSAGPWYNYNASVPLGSNIWINAVANPNYAFSSWSGTAYSGSANPVAITMNAPANETANFVAVTPTPAPTYYGVTLYSSPPNGGTVSYGWSSAGPWYNYNASVPAGSTIWINAAANSNYAFSSWSGTGYSGSTNPIAIAMNAPINETAKFVVVTPTPTPTPTYYPTYTPVPTATPITPTKWWTSGDALCWRADEAKTGNFQVDFDGNHDTIALSWGLGWYYQYGNFADLGVASKSGGATQYGWAIRVKENATTDAGKHYSFGGSEYFYLYAQKTAPPADWVVCAKRSDGQNTLPLGKYYVSLDNGATWSAYEGAPTATVTATAIPYPTATATTTATPAQCAYPYQCMDVEKAKALGCAQVPDAVCPQLVAAGTDTSVYPALQMNCYKCPLPTPIPTVTAYPTATPISCEEKCKQAYGKDEAGAANCIERECKKTPAAIIHMGRGFGIASDYNVLVLAVKLLPNARGFGAMKFAGKKYKLREADYSGDTLTAKVFDAGSEVGSIKVRVEERDGVATASGSLTLANASYRAYLFRYVRGAYAGAPANAWAILPRFG